MQPVIVRRLLPDFGTTYGPAGEGPFPGIVVLHGSEGGWSGWSHRIAVILAAHGFIAYPHPYSRSANFWNAGAIKDVPLETTVAALRAFRSFSPCSGKAGIYGVSRGAEHALLVATLMAKYDLEGSADAIAAHAAPDVVCGAFDAKNRREQGDPGWRAWDPSERAWSWNGQSDDLLPTTPIEIERYDGPIFLSHGLADAVWSPDMTRRLEARLRRAGRQPVVCLYDDEPHVPTSAGENRHNEDILSFFSAHLSLRVSN
ncbi:bile acid acyltransferase/acyl-CoA thioester hydrolase-like protein [Roseibium hamelinense]|uniref:Bile acid acyltransferase/acyl-CoA thioester hydrolase-like protein n=1 Tax=Roseibium hamelinense TaxID=150831 RepID=A0A562T2F8_9HYPH|nr:acyl-CoA thioester hydrolase/BAAT C-terminal domain-containing protein [Roseibium hamelinense]MTI44471.1 alpha/beta hydrolase [Roseibium hamelinense]TWI87438.1 bile acid acyltransferase/acyl-CoA thioester hydrolase-like protein [Roseibium hamelinense]